MDSIEIQTVRQYHRSEYLADAYRHHRDSDVGDDTWAALNAWEADLMSLELKNLYSGPDTRDREIVKTELATAEKLLDTAVAAGVEFYDIYHRVASTAVVLALSLNEFDTARGVFEVIAKHADMTTRRTRHTENLSASSHFGLAFVAASQGQAPGELNDRGEIRRNLLMGQAYLTPTHQIVTGETFDEALQRGAGLASVYADFSRTWGLSDLEAAFENINSELTPMNNHRG